MKPLSLLPSGSFLPPRFLPRHLLPPDTLRYSSLSLLLLSDTDTYSGIKYGVEIDLPAATILNIFGLRAQVRFSLTF